LQALRESAFDYLLKPFTPEELRLVMNRFFAWDLEQKRMDSFVEVFSRLMPECRTFLIATITGFQTLRPDDIGYFEYSKSRKHWFVFLMNKNSLQLRRNTSAETILGYSSSFAQINQQQIINVKYLSIIDGKQCQLFPPFDDEKNLTISRSFIKGIQEKFELI
jgi:two-component system LytT family response regulator